MEPNREHPFVGTRAVRWTWHSGAVTGACARNATLLEGSPSGITLSRWRLWFRARRNDTAPASQTVAVWTGNNAPFTWRAQSDAWWLDATPDLLSGSKSVQIGPTTTALADGIYEGTVRIVTSEFARPTPLEVGYEIYTTADAQSPPAPTGPELWCVPNPARPGQTVQVRYVLEQPGAVRLRLLDALGREVATIAEGRRERGAHSAMIALPGTISSGMYFLSMESGGGNMMRGVAVVR
jgi:hypothetical protein